MAARKAKAQPIMVDAPRRSTRSSAVDKPASARISPESASTSRPTTASSMDDFEMSPAKSESQSPKRTTKRKSKSLSPDFEEIERQPTRRSSRKISPVEPVYDVEDIIEDPLEFIQTPATNEELETWKGWVELESEPAFFNVMLRDLGVEGVKIQEVFSLDEEMLEMIPKPIYGLIFLFQFKEDDPSQQETSCPENIWFANQTTNNACATIALLNIVMNAAEVEIGPTLNSLKSFSAAMTPALRGYTVGNHDYIRRIHNSFARKMDMLNADLSLYNDMAASKARAAAKSYSKKDVDTSEAGFHFVAFVPIGGNLWKLDGLERQPMNLGDCTEEDWLEIAKPLIEERMAQYEDDQIQFNLLAVCKSPLATVKTELCENIHTLVAIEEALKKSQPDWESFITEDEKHRFLRGPDEQYQITADDFNASSGNENVIKELSGQVTNARLMELQKQHSDRQKQLKMALLEEATEIQQDNETAASRRHDFTPLINTWLAALAEKEKLRELAERYPDDTQ